MKRTLPHSSLRPQQPPSQSHRAMYQEDEHSDSPARDSDSDTDDYEEEYEPKISPSFKIKLEAGLQAEHRGSASSWFSHGNSGRAPMSGPGSEDWDEPASSQRRGNPSRRGRKPVWPSTIECEDDDEDFQAEWGSSMRGPDGRFLEPGEVVMDDFEVKREGGADHFPPSASTSSLTSESGGLDDSASSHGQSESVACLHQCQYCAASFVEANNLRRHIIYIHPDKPRPPGRVSKVKRRANKKCDECGKIFTRTSRLKRHKLVHTGERPYPCDQCSKTFTQASNLKNHLNLHTGSRPFVCEICSKTFSDSGNLRKHKVIHTGDKPFVCDVCNKAFVETGHLKRHKRIHTGLRPYICDVCNKAFMEAGTLKRHKVQTNHNPIICFVCNRTFHRQEQLDEHSKVHEAPAGKV